MKNNHWIWIILSLLLSIPLHKIQLELEKTMWEGLTRGYLEYMILWNIRLNLACFEYCLFLVAKDLWTTHKMSLPISLLPEKEFDASSLPATFRDFKFSI